MRKLGRKFGAGISLFLFLGASLALAQEAPQPQEQKAPSASMQETTGSSETAATVPDHAKAYYHFMMARRYKELAGVYNRSDYVDKAISEYKQAIEADPTSLFLQVELAELYWRTARVGDAIREADGVLKKDPDYPDAHRLLARIYWHMLGDTQSDKAKTKASLGKAIEHLEALVRIDPSDTDSWLVLGRLYKINGQPEKAAEALRKVISADPDSETGVRSLAQLYFEQGEYQQAVDLLKKFPQDDMDPSLLGMLAYAYTQTHDYDSAVSTYQKALAQDSDNQDLRRAYADALLGADKNDDARAEFEKVLKADPEDGYTYLRLAQLDRSEGRFDQARDELARAKSLQPDNLEIPYQQALLEDTLGNQDKAIPIMQDLVKQSARPSGQYTAGEANNHAVFLERLGMMYREQEKFDLTLDTFRQILDLGQAQAPRGEALIVETLRLDRQPGKAMAEADAAIQKYPQDRALRVMRATMLGENGKVDEAITQLEALLNKTPSDRDIYLTIAQVYSQAKRFPQAEEAARKALALIPKPEDQEYAHFVLGSVYEREKKYDLAEEQFKKVLAMNPLNASASNYLGYMLAERGVRLEESVKYIKKALQLDPNNGAYLDSLGWAYYKMSRYDLAEPHLEKAARLIRNDPTIHEHLGSLYLRMGKKTQAQQEWERALREWPKAVSSDFDAEQAAKLRKRLDELKVELAKEHTAQATQQ